MPPIPAPTLRDLSSRYRSVRAATGKLCEPLTPEDCAIQSMPDASPAKWHLAHTTWFFETLVLERVPGYGCFHPRFRVLFNSYYNTVGEQYPRPQRGMLSRPTLDEVRAYRVHVDRSVLALLESGDAAPEVREIVELGLHHEQQHQELLVTDVLHMLAHNPLRPAYSEKIDPAPAPDPGPLGWISFDEGVREIGHGGEGFAFDNERPRHRVFVDAFELASRPVTNGELLAFMQDDGYARPELWLSDGWAAVEAQRWRAPLYWEERDGGWASLTSGGMRDIRSDEPVCHVSYFEADAFARWSGARLPTEAEWETAATGAALDGNFVESGWLHPAPSGPAEGSPAALFGDVWEWTGSAYTPYPGFRPLAGSLAEYNGKFMSNQMVLRGGSCATPRSHMRASYRNFFYPDARWQFSGIRLARDAS
jgi:ergothioneine biosynthesis protein EgtB